MRANFNVSASPLRLPWALERGGLSRKEGLSQRTRTKALGGLTLIFQIPLHTMLSTHLLATPVVMTCSTSDSYLAMAAAKDVSATLAFVNHGWCISLFGKLPNKQPTILCTVKTYVKRVSVNYNCECLRAVSAVD